MRDYEEYIYVCAECGWQLQFGTTPILFLGDLRHDIIAFLIEHEAECDHGGQWFLRSFLLSEMR